MCIVTCENLRLTTIRLYFQNNNWSLELRPAVSLIGYYHFFIVLFKLNHQILVIIKLLNCICEFQFQV